ncbi:hypothetical protein QR680_000569 [Steinernema hermaphroditum]|uniref:Uncharacterized protein n=1 Tax=Steinernema hermaphroditum TaxID=289476 RepID=A0AA39GXV3_9BILA|nr:hypothetical protein QR680_000569 [Steinernema hermaphroditum]
MAFKVTMIECNHSDPSTSTAFNAQLEQRIGLFLDAEKDLIWSIVLKERHDDSSANPTSRRFWKEMKKTYGEALPRSEQSYITKMIRMCHECDTPEVNQDQETILKPILSQILQMSSEQISASMEPQVTEEEEQGCSSKCGSDKIGKDDTDDCDEKEYQRRPFNTEEIKQLWNLVMPELRLEGNFKDDPKQSKFWIKMKQKHPELWRQENTYAKKFQALMDRMDFEMLSEEDRLYMHTKLKTIASARFAETSSSVRAMRSKRRTSLRGETAKKDKLEGNTIPALEVPQMFNDLFGRNPELFQRWTELTKIMQEQVRTMLSENVFVPTNGIFEDALKATAVSNNDFPELVVESSVDTVAEAPSLAFESPTATGPSPLPLPQMPLSADAVTDAANAPMSETDLQNVYNLLQSNEGETLTELFAENGGYPNDSDLGYIDLNVPPTSDGESTANWIAERKRFVRTVAVKTMDTTETSSDTSTVFFEDPLMNQQHPYEMSHSIMGLQAQEQPSLPEGPAQEYMPYPVVGPPNGTIEDSLTAVSINDFPEVVVEPASDIVARALPLAFESPTAAGPSSLPLPQMPLSAPVTDAAAAPMSEADLYNVYNLLQSNEGGSLTDIFAEDVLDDAENAGRPSDSDPGYIDLNIPPTSDSVSTANWIAERKRFVRTVAMNTTDTPESSPETPTAFREVALMNLQHPYEMSQIIMDSEDSLRLSTQNVGTQAQEHPSQQNQPLLSTCKNFDVIEACVRRADPSEGMPEVGTNSISGRVKPHKPRDLTKAILKHIVKYNELHNVSRRWSLDRLNESTLEQLKSLHSDVQLDCKDAELKDVFVRWKTIRGEVHVPCRNREYCHLLPFVKKNQLMNRYQDRIHNQHT